MITLVDGPAQGQVLALHRDPMFLRIVVSPSGKWDGLDQLEDEPKPRETIHVYRKVTPTTWVHLNMGSTRRGSGFYPMAAYAFVEDVDGETMRETAAWRAWAKAQPSPVPMYDETIPGDRERAIAELEASRSSPDPTVAGEQVGGTTVGADDPSPTAADTSGPGSSEAPRRLDKAAATAAAAGGDNPDGTPPA